MHTFRPSVDLPFMRNFGPLRVPIRLFKERVICIWRKFIRMSIRPLGIRKTDKIASSDASGQASTGLPRLLMFPGAFC